MAAILWGFSGIAAQELFQHYQLQPTWLAAVRVAGAGILLALWAGPRGRTQSLRRFTTDKRRLITIIVFGVVALDGVQITFFLAIAHGTAVSATSFAIYEPGAHPWLGITPALQSTETAPRRPHRSRARGRVPGGDRRIIGWAGDTVDWGSMGSHLGWVHRTLQPVADRTSV